MAAACRVDGFGRKRVRSFSQGMKQQLTLAIAYATGARYLLLDEPMNALDPTNVAAQALGGRIRGRRLLESCSLRVGLLCNGEAV